jgi:hypothetical protein
LGPLLPLPGHHAPRAAGAYATCIAVPHALPETHCAVLLPPRLPQALATFGSDIGIAFSGAEDVALIEYAHLTGRPYRVFR